jgi:hypothetical protein
VDAPPPALDPAIERIKNPTAAQAILAAMDRDLAHHDGTQKGDQLYDYRRRQIAGQYLGALIKLGDKRIAATLAERAGVAERAGDARMRRQWASAAHALGEAAPLARFADDFTAGRIELPKNDKPLTNDNDQPGRVELADIVANLAAAASNLPAADRALYALAEPTHPLYAEVAQRVLSDSRSSSEGPWLAHPFCIAIIRRELDDMTLTGRRFWISDDGKTLEYKEDRSSGSSGLPEFLADPAARVATADERLCDRAATLANAVFGVPATHPLLKENDARLAQIRNLIDRFGRRFRMLNRAERDALQVPFWEAHFIPDIKPLGRPATDADVNEGRAIFALPQGKGALASGVKLPATCKRKDAKAGSGGLFGRPDVRLLIVQAETDADGKLMYGVLGPRGLQAIPADEVIEITEISAKVAE